MLLINLPYYIMRWLRNLLNYLLGRTLEEKLPTEKEYASKITEEEGEFLDIYTDGSCIGNGTEKARGAWAFVVPEIPRGMVLPNIRSVGSKLVFTDATETKAEGSGKLELPDGVVHTNNKAEFQAITEALRFAKNVLYVKNIRILTDSQYVVNALTGQKTAYVNKEFIRIIHELARKFNEVQFEWVPAHAGNKANQEADKLARKVLGLKTRYNPHRKHKKKNNNNFPKKNNDKR